MHLDVAVGHEGNGDEAPARADERGDDTDDGPRPEHPGRPRKMAGRCGLATQEHLRGRKIHEGGEDERHPEGGEGPRNLGADHGAAKNPGRHRGDDVPENRTAGSVRSHGRERRKEDGAHGRGDRRVDDVFLRDARRTEKHREKGRQYHAAADTEQAGQKASACPEESKLDDDGEIHDVM